MKKLVLFVSVLFVASFGSCSKEDEIGSKKKLFNPPTWIQGVWEYKIQVTGISSIKRYTFTKNNVIDYTETKQGSAEGTETTVDFAKMYNLPVHTIIEKNESDNYTINIDSKGGGATQKYSYSFRKTDTDKLELYISGVKTLVYTKK